MTGNPAWKNWHSLILSLYQSVILIKYGEGLVDEIKYIY